MNSRKQQANPILATPNMIAQTNIGTFKVKSMTTLDKYYTVSRTGNGLVCGCPDHQYRKSDCKHIHIILNIISHNRVYVNNKFKIMRRTKLNLCKHCSFGNIKKNGYHTNKRDKLQRFKCLECMHKFTTNFRFENKQFSNGTITASMQIYFSGMYPT